MTRRALRRSTRFAGLTLLCPPSPVFARDAGRAPDGLLLGFAPCHAANVAGAASPVKRRPDDPLNTNSSLRREAKGAMSDTGSGPGKCS